MSTDRANNQYQLKCIGIDKSFLPIDLEMVRHYVNASLTESDDVLHNVVVKACEQAELMTYKSILHRTWQLTHKRSDIILKMPPIKKILSVFYKGLKKWSKVDLNDVEEILINGGERRIIIPNILENQTVRVIYTAGSTNAQAIYDYCDHVIDNKCALSYAMQQLVLKLCAAHYAKVKTSDLDAQTSVMQLCTNYSSQWNDPIF
jgi:hypothetical protein